MKSFFYNNAPDKLLGALFSFKRFFILVISLLIFVQCTKEIEFDFEPDTEPTIVLNCIFQPNSPISLHVSKTGSILEPLLPVDDTFRLKLFENSMLRVDTSFFGSEFKSELFVNPGSTYSLKLDSKEYNEIYSSDTLPELVNIRDAFVVFPAGIDSYGDYLAEANIEFNDPAEVSNYYELLIFSGEKNLSYWTSYHDINITDPVLINEGDIDYHPQSLFFSDELFDGTTYVLKVKGYVGYSYNSNGFIPSPVYASLRSVSKAYYLYRKYYTRHAFNQQIEGDALDLIYKGEPQNMYTNIINGYGIFAGYQETTIQLYHNK